MRRKTQLMKKLFMLSFALFAAGLAMWAGYSLQGAHVDSEGMLREPFYLLAMGWFVNFAGVSSLLAGFSLFIARKRAGR